MALPSVPQLSDGAPSLTTLPSELIVRIIDFTDPSAHLDLAVTCRLLAQCSRDAMRQHQKCQERYGVCSDRMSETVPALLRNVLRDPVIGWHIRWLTFYGAQVEWEDLPEYRLHRDEEHDFPNASCFTQSEMDEIMDLSHEKLRYSGHNLVEMRRVLERGDDTSVKVLLMALCPRLRSVAFLQYSETRAGHGSRVSNEDVTLVAFSKAIRTIFEATDADALQPPGFRSIRHITVDTPAEPYLGQTRREATIKGTAPLFLLPAIQSLRISRLKETDEENTSDGSDFGFPEASSSVKHLWIEDAQDIELVLIGRLVAAPKRLETLVVRGGMIDGAADGFVSNAAHYHADTLESLVLYDSSGFKGYRCSIYLPSELTRFTTLRHVTVEIEDVFLEAMYKYGFDDQKPTTHGCGHDGVVEYFVENGFPTSLEAIVFRSNDNITEWDAEAVDDGIVALLETDKYHSLKAIYLEAVEWPSSTNDPGQEKTKLWFQRAMRVGKVRGVDIHTRTNRGPWMHEIGFPRVPDHHRIGGEAHQGLPPDHDTVFDPYSGRDKARGCDYCGSCEDCYRYYDERLWAQRL